MKLSLILVCSFAALAYASVVPQFGGRIVGGREAIPHSAPYMAVLRWGITPALRGQQLCGGVILNENWVVTAAHCIMTTGTTRIVGGDHIFSIDEPNEQLTDIIEFIIHEGYNSNTLANDIALLKCSTPFVFNQFVHGIDLPPAGREHTGMTQVFGWGSTSNTTTAVSPDYLQTADKEIIPLETCRSRFTNPALVTASNVCTGPLNSNIDTCGGDSGGPTVQTIGGVTELVGIVSFGPSPCGAGPSVNTKMSPYTSWIIQHAFN